MLGPHFRPKKIWERMYNGLMQTECSIKPAIWLVDNFVHFVTSRLVRKFFDTTNEILFSRLSVQIVFLLEMKKITCFFFYSSFGRSAQCKIESYFCRNFKNWKETTCDQSFPLDHIRNSEVWEKCVETPSHRVASNFISHQVESLHILLNHFTSARAETAIITSLQNMHVKSLYHRLSETHLMIELHIRPG